MKAQLYTRGLLMDGQRKSMQPMAQRLDVDHQQLQQFITTSPWSVRPVRKALAHKAITLIGAHVWAIDDVGFPKEGVHSPGVARQYSGALGKVDNCQIAVSTHAVTDEASAPLLMDLFLGESWDERATPKNTRTPAHTALIAQRRVKAAIPDTARHVRKWEMAIAQLDQLADWGHTPPAVVADAGYGDSAQFRLALTAREIPYIVAIKSATSAYPDDAVPTTADYSGRGRRPTPKYPDEPLTCKDLILAAGRDNCQQITWRHGSKPSPANPDATLSATFSILTVRPANRDIPRNPDGTLTPQTLIAQWPPQAPEPTDYWLSTMPPDTPTNELIRTAKMRWRIEHDYRELKTGLGIDHFEGRSYPGWYHHTTLVLAAHLFLTTLRLTAPKASGQA